MRVTDRSIFDAANKSTSAARSRLEQAAGEMSSGVRVSHPGDDPAAAMQSVVLGAEKSGQQSRTKALDAAQSELDMVDGALGVVTDLIRRAQELSTQLGSDTFTAPERAAAGAEIDGLITSVITQLNTKVGDRYVFGGTKDDVSPFSAAGAYSGASTSRQIEIFPGIYQQSSVRADVAIKGVGGGVDVISTLQQLSSDLKANNGNGIRSAIGNLETGLNQVLLARSQTGTFSNVVSMATSAAKVAEDDAVRRRAAAVEVDPFAAASNLALAQRALDAALTASAKSFELTLLNKLR